MEAIYSSLTRGALQRLFIGHVHWVSGTSAPYEECEIMSI